MTRRLLPLFVAPRFALTLGVFLWTVPARAQYQVDGYDLDRTISIEAEVVHFMVFADSYARIYVSDNTRSELKRNTVRLEWLPSSLSSQGITSQWLQGGDRIVVTGHPHRLDNGAILVRTITRPADGWKWIESQPASTPGLGAPAGQSLSGPATPNTSAGSVASHAGSAASTDQAAGQYISALVDKLAIAERYGWSDQQEQDFIECTGYEYAVLTKEFLAHPEVRASGRTTVDVNEKLGQDSVNQALVRCQQKSSPAGAFAGKKPAGGLAPGAPNAPSSTPLAGGAPTAALSVPGSPAATPPPPVTKAPPQQTETLAESQAKINQDVTSRTNSILADLKKTAEAQQAQAAAASQAAARPPAAPGPSPGASAGSAWQPCGGELRSGASQTVVRVEFVSVSKQPRKLFWFDFAGSKILAGTLQPGQRAPMQTYTTHAWMIADGSDQCMGTLVISKAGSIEIR